jgi:hypothetical protein
MLFLLGDLCVLCGKIRILLHGEFVFNPQAVSAGGW